MDTDSRDRGLTHTKLSSAWDTGFAWDVRRTSMRNIASGNEGYVEVAPIQFTPCVASVEPHKQRVVVARQNRVTGGRLIRKFTRLDLTL